MKYLLCLDTSGGACTACVYDMDTQLSLACVFEDMPYGQAGRIMSMVDEVVKDADIQKSDISAVGCCHGPGYFTGMRIGISTAQGLAVGLNAQLYSVSSTQSMAFQAKQYIKDSLDITVIMETKRSDFYVQSFHGVSATSDIMSLQADEITPNPILVGSGITRYKDTVDVSDFHIVDCPPYPSADTIARAICHMGDACLGVDALYLRAPDVKPPKQGA